MAITIHFQAYPKPQQLLPLFHLYQYLLQQYPLPLRKSHHKGNHKFYKHYQKQHGQSDVLLYYFSS